jgi:clorobiocin biosynthesis protein CloN6
MPGSAEETTADVPFPTVRADLLLVHAPASFDFRHRSDIYFPFLSTSGDVPITPLYEYFPIGFKTLQRYLGERGHDVKIVNLSSVLLRYPEIDVKAFLRAIEVRAFGVDLHWMVHVQGALAVASLIKSIHPETPIIFGGISSTYYAEELIRYPYIDMVMRGYDTHEPMQELMTSLSKGIPPRTVPNLLWKEGARGVVDNGFSYLPDSFSCGTDWSELPAQPETDSLPILEVLSTQNAGCSRNCGWCGGSRDSFRRINGARRTVARKPLDQVTYEFETLSTIPNLDQYYFYSVGSYNEPVNRMLHFLDLVAASGIGSISYEQFDLTPDELLYPMARANPKTAITLSPESHDLRVSKLAGRGNYTPDEMERWIRKALDAGIHQIDVWFFIGMPEQDARSVAETVEYCGRLLKMFKGERVLPLLCPMIPFLDPASNFFEYPEEHGYRVFYRTVEEHRRGMERASLINRINFETAWLSREELVEVGFTAVRRLVELKAEFGVLPDGISRSVIGKIDDALHWTRVVHEIDLIADASVRERELTSIGPEILSRNDAVFFSGVANQAFPVNREIGGRWFDEMLHDPEVFRSMTPDAAATPAR